MQSRQQLQQLISSFSLDKFVDYFKLANDKFTPSDDDYSHYIDDNKDSFGSLSKLGEISFDDAQRLIVVATESDKELTSRTGKKKQYELARKILKAEMYDAGIFIFFDQKDHFRFSLVVAQYVGKKRKFSTFRRYTYFVTPELPNKTFLNQIGKADFSSINKILAAFSIEAVSNVFYNDFEPKFKKIADAVQGAEKNGELKQDFALLFVIRIIFLGFVQKKKWLGGKEHFIQEFWKEYSSQFSGDDNFYKRWLEPLFFEALNSPPGRKVKYQDNEFSSETEKILQQAPYLNGELFKNKEGVDGKGLWLPDDIIGEFLDFLFQYNFTIEENTCYDEELELNPEFLGIIFERLVNKADGAVYTPRTEVDLMCRMALVKWMEKNSACEKYDLYHLFFREGGIGVEFDEDQKQGDFSTKQIRELIDLLENITVCDPAAGSGAFEVGMLHVLHEVFHNLYNRPNAPGEIEPKTPFELKKSIIGNSLYGVEVKRWAVWINQLRLWLTLFIDMPDEDKHSVEPLLPNLNFKVRCGDSLVQRIGTKMFPVHEHAQLSVGVKRKITDLKKLKVDFFHNRGKSTDYVRSQENIIFKEILNEEIQQKRKELKYELNSNKEVKSQDDLSFIKKPSEVEFNSKATEETLIKIEIEIKELEEQKKNLKDDHPLIWNIEFAEIFFDKNGFDIIIGNPPYVRQEEIAEPYGKMTPKDYKSALQEMVRMDFPNHFRKKGKIDGKSDLYTYFYIRSLHLLNPKGVHVFICSNSWLDVGYGTWMQHFLLKNVPIHFIIDNHAKRSFASSDINTIISILDAPAKQLKKDEHKVKFVAFKQSFEEVILTENLLDIENAHEIVKNEGYRVFPITTEKLLEEGTEYEGKDKQKRIVGKYIGDKWGGKYLRAPDVFIKIMNDFGKKIIKLGEVSNVITISWSRLGRNSELIVPNSGHNIKKNEVELFKSPRDIESINIKGNDTKFRLKIDKEILRKVKYAPLLWGDLKDKKHICHYCADKVAFTHNFHGLIPFEKNQVMVLCALLNSTITWLFTEIYGRVGLGGGALRILVQELKAVYPIVNPAILNKKRILDAFFEIKDRPIRDTFSECGIDPKSDIPIAEQEPNPLPDRVELDKVVFDALDLTVEERKDVYRAVCQLVWNRISKAKSV